MLHYAHQYLTRLFRAQLRFLGSIHRLKMKKGTIIPAHTHPSNEFVYVISGTVTTGGRVCEKGTFWETPAGVRQGPHEAMTDLELMTVRLGAMGEFEGL